MRWREIVAYLAENGGKVVKGVNTTPDVQPGEIARQAAKFGFHIGPDGSPPIWTSHPASTNAKDTPNKDETGEQTFYGPDGMPPKKNSPSVKRS